MPELMPWGMLPECSLEFQRSPEDLMQELSPRGMLPECSLEFQRSLEESPAEKLASPEKSRGLWRLAAAKSETSKGTREDLPDGWPGKRTATADWRRRVLVQGHWCAVPHRNLARREALKKSQEISTFCVWEERERVENNSSVIEKWQVLK